MLFLNEQLTNTNHLSEPLDLPSPSPLSTPNIDRNYNTSLDLHVEQERTTKSFETPRTDEFFKDLLWSTSAAVDPSYKPEYMNVVHSNNNAYKPSPPEPDRRNSLPVTALVQKELREKKVKPKVRASFAQESSPKNKPMKSTRRNPNNQSNRRAPDNRFESLSYVPRMFSHLKTNLATESQMPNKPSKKSSNQSGDKKPGGKKQSAISSTYKTTNNETYVLQGTTRRHSYLKNPPNRNRLPNNIATKRHSVASEIRPSSAQKSSSQAKPSQGNSSGKKEKPKFIVSHLPNQPLPIYRR